ncbi:MAG: ABC transporter substrate-binding protein [Candidatus Micrarchaeota archaeon]
MKALAQALLVGLILIVVGAVLFLPGLSLTGKVTASNTEVVKFAYVPAQFNAIPIIAMRNGYFADEGIKIEEIRTSFVGYVFQQLATNEIDMITGAETPGVFMALKGGNYKIIATHEISTNDETVVMMKNKNIKSIRDLAEKKVGTVLYSVVHYNLWNILEKNNVSPKAVTMIDISPQTMASALSHGDVDAIFSYEPVPNKIIAAFGDEVSSIVPPSNMEMNLYVSRQFAEKTATQKKMLRAMKRAENFIKTNPDEAIAILAKETEIDETTMKKLWSKMQFELREFNSSARMTEIARWAIDNNISASRNIPNFTALNAPAPLREVLAEQANP